MKRILVLVLIASLLLAAGCTTRESGPAAAPGAGLPGTLSPLPGTTVEAQKANEPAVMQNGTYTISASIDTLEVDSSKPGKKILDIYIRAVNTGTKPVQLVWYSKITDAAGRSHGGIGVSHGGSGATTTLLEPGYSETARDYIVIESEPAFAALEGGGVLDVSFIGQPASGGSKMMFHASWAIDPDRIR